MFQSGIWFGIPGPLNRILIPTGNVNRTMADKPIKKIICPVCKKEAVWRDNPFRPFCSERCKLIDLGKWAAEDYRIPGEKKDLPEGDGEE